MDKSHIERRAEALIKRRTEIFEDIRRLTKILKSARTRLARLRQKKLYIEHIAFGGQIIEYLLVRTIHIHSMCIDEMLFTQNSSLKLKSEVQVNTDKDTAGVLISKLSTVRSDDELIDELKDFFFRKKKQGHASFI